MGDNNSYGRRSYCRSWNDILFGRRSYDYGSYDGYGNDGGKRSKNKRKRKNKGCSKKRGY